MAHHENLPNKLISSVFGLSAGSVLLHLLDWVRLHKADVDEKAKEVLQSESPAEHCDYWDVVSSSTHYILHKFCIQLVLWSEISCLVLRFWPLQVVSYILQGRLEEARQMLMKQAVLHPAARNMYKLMDSLLSRMPFYNVCFQLLFVHFCWR